MNEPIYPDCRPPRPVTPPLIPLPPLSCDTHAHIFGPPSLFPYSEDRSYTPPDAVLSSYLRMLETMGFDRGVLVQGSAHGTDNSAMLAALDEHPDKLRGVAVVASGATFAELKNLAARGVRALRFNHFFRNGRLHYRGGIGLSVAQELNEAMAELGLHAQVWIDVNDLPETLPKLQRLTVPIIIDHMGRTSAAAGINTEGFQALLKCLGEGRCWVKLSGAHRLSNEGPDYATVRPFQQALVRANPDQLVWGSDWPHPRVEGEMPDAGHLLDLFQAWTPDAALRKKILVENPARLYGFP